MARAWSKFLSDVAKARDTLEFEPNEECFYRGHGSSSWSLLPTLLRQCAEQEIDDLDDIRLIESALYFEFRARAQVIQPDTPNDWEVLFTMRHHSIATRLLDWTEVLAIAVYFAIRDAPTSSKPCVWLLNPYKLNEVSWELRDLIAPEHLLETADEFSDYLIDYTKKSGFDWAEPVAIYPLRKNARLHAQRGYFTIHGDDIRPLEEIMPDAVARVDLPKAARSEALRFMEDAGINEYLLFPDLDGLARYLQAKYEIA